MTLRRSQVTDGSVRPPVIKKASRTQSGRATVPPAPLERDLQGPGLGLAGFGGGMAWTPIAKLSMLGADVCDEALGRKLHSLGRMQREAPSQLGIDATDKNAHRSRPIVDDYGRLTNSVPVGRQGQPWTWQQARPSLQFARAEGDARSFRS